MEPEQLEKDSEQEQEVDTMDSLLDEFVEDFDNEPEQEQPEQDKDREQPEQEEREEEEQEDREQDHSAETPAPQTYLLDGEEVTEAQLKEWRGKAIDYTQKTQQLAKEREIVQPFAPLNAFLQQNPDKLKEVIDLVQGQQQPVQEQPPEDPIEALKWEAKNEALAEFRKEFAPIQQNQEAMARKQAVDQTMQQVQRDPAYAETHGKLDAYVKGDYAKIHGVEQAKALYQRLDNDPNLYMSMYQRFREQPDNKQALENRTATRNAPVIDASGGRLPPTPKQKQKVARGKELNNLAKKVYESGRSEDLVNYIHSSGFADFLA